MKVKKLVQETYEKAEECLNVNYYGVKRVTEALIPLLQLAQSARVVNVSSRYGQLRVRIQQTVPYLTNFLLTRYDGIGLTCNPHWNQCQFKPKGTLSCPLKTDQYGTLIFLMCVSLQFTMIEKHYEVKSLIAKKHRHGYVDTGATIWHHTPA